MIAVELRIRGEKYLTARRQITFSSIDVSAYGLNLVHKVSRTKGIVSIGPQTLLACHIVVMSIGCTSVKRLSSMLVNNCMFHVHLWCVL